jgi:hypothetical protein
MNPSKKDNPSSSSKKASGKLSSSKKASSKSSASSSSSVTSSHKSEDVAEITELLQDISIPKEIEEIFIPKEIERFEQTPTISSLKKKKIMFSPDTELTTSNPIADVLNFVELLESIHQDSM